MSEKGEADVLIVDDQPYSSGTSNGADDDFFSREEEEKKEDLIEQVNEEEKAPRKPAEPIFVPVITGTATLESNAYSDKTHYSTQNSQKDQIRNVPKDEKKASKCCLLI